MTSFIANGHPLNLHVYEPPESVPEGILLQDATAILPRRELFTHARSGSYAIFADWFRYRLLHEHGGLWVDTDIVCLRPFDHEAAEIFARQDNRIINNAVLGLPRGHRLAQWMMELCESPNRILPYDSFRTRRRKLARRLLNRGTAATEWGETGPEGFTAAARHLGFDDKALPAWHFYPIGYRDWHTVFDAGSAQKQELLSGSYGLHLWNEMTRLAPAFDRNAAFPPDSIFERLCARYGVP